MTLVLILNYVIWESYKQKNCFRSIFVHFCLYIGFELKLCDFDHFCLAFLQFHSKVKFNGTLDRSRWDLYNHASFELKLCYLRSYKPKTVSAPFLSIFVSSVLWFWPWHFSNFTQKWNSMVQVDRSRWDLYNNTSFELKLCYLRKL